MASKVLKMSNNNTELTLLNVFATKLNGGAGENILIEIAMCLPVQEIAHLFETSLIKQLNKSWKQGDQDPLCHIKVLFTGMKRVYTLYTTSLNYTKIYDQRLSSLYHVNRFLWNARVEWNKRVEKRLLKKFPLLIACRVGSDEVVRVLVNEHDKYITNVYQLIPNVYKSRKKNPVHNLTDMINVSVNIRDVKLKRITKNALHECIYFYNEQRNVENCGKRLAILRMLSNKHDFTLPCTISYLVPHVWSGGGSTRDPDGWMVWRPMACVQACLLYPSPSPRDS